MGNSPVEAALLAKPQPPDLDAPIRSATVRERAPLARGGDCVIIKTVQAWRVREAFQPEGGTDA